MVSIVKVKDLNGWLDLAREVEPLFGTMLEDVDFIKGVENCISNSSAFCIKSNRIDGLIAIDKTCNEISWLAVRGECRGKGYGYQLIKAALVNLDNNKPIYVQTFSPNEKAGETARNLYLRFGFKDFKDAGKDPAGIDTIIMRLGE